MNKFSAFIAGLVFISLCFLLGIAISAFITLQLWTWFAIPLGAPIIQFWHAAGIALLMNWFTHKQTTPLSKDVDKQALAVAQMTDGLLYPVLTLIFGYVIHLLML